MAASPENHRKESTDVKTLVSDYSNHVWRKLFSFFPSRDSNLFDKISNLHLIRTTGARGRRRKPGLPLPLPSNSLEFSGVMFDESRVLDALDTILEHILANLHDIQKSLHFWQSRAEGSGAQKVYFMVFERGPWAFINGTVQLIRGCMSGGSPVQHLCHSAVAQISERIAVLTRLQHCLAKFLAQVVLILFPLLHSEFLYFSILFFISHRNTT
ncbi:protein DGS1, mitochondrial-like [Telopea speciosissima]|uniref:protein DGS1, mitochondrial-like n=1 Tax=Telopea speciosissima TaxID=54955 RepID=UPI001CC5B3A9|nr:protein DGS1, mitochondrial-like [Telopea speciosissima]